MGLRINKNKTRITKVQTDDPQTATGHTKKVEEFTNWGSLVSSLGSTVQDVEAILGKAMSVFHWQISKEILTVLFINIFTSPRIISTLIGNILMLKITTNFHSCSHINLF